MEKFAGYGFNKSHAAAYALVAYQTAYLIFTFPPSGGNRPDGGYRYGSAFLRRRGSYIALAFWPDVNFSLYRFLPVSPGNRFGLARSRVRARRRLRIS
jgi:DNA polymerase-3 subunit alpha